MFTLFMIIFSP